MAQAIKDNRCAQCAINARALSNFLGGNPTKTGLIYDTAVTPYYATNNPTGSTSITSLPNLTGISGYAGPSYPVYVDPVGATLLSLPTVGYPNPVPPATSWIGFGRVSPSYYASATDILRWFTLSEDINFQLNPATGYACPPNAAPPAFPNPGAVQREDRYSWAYLLRQPIFGTNNNLANRSVVIYSGRSQTAPGETSYGGPGGANGAPFVQLMQNSTQVVIFQDTWQLAVPPKPKPAIRSGSWILDVTVLDASGTNPDPHGLFYRVVDVQDGVDPGGSGKPVLLLQLQTPLLQSSSVGIIAVMENVVEVLNLPVDQ
jgi:hypothetical protein